MKERSLLFGEGKNLVGIVTEPDGAPAPGTLPAVLLLNAGVLHHIGPNRVYVRLARQLAEAGFLVMRFDYSGLGDSRPGDGRTPFVRRALAEARAAMSVLESSRGARRFVLIGLCSGADNAVQAASQDERVVGAALLEPYAVPGRGYLLYQYRRKLLDPRSWWRLLSGRSELLSLLRRAPAPAPKPEAVTPAPARDEEQVNEQILPSAAEFVAQVQRLVARGAALCFVYSSESPAYFNYLALLRRALAGPAREGRVLLAALRRTDHAFTPLRAQDELVETLVSWAARFRP